MDWRAVTVIVAVQAVSFGTSIYSFTFFVVPWREAFDIGVTPIMWAGLVLSLIAGLAGPAVAVLLDRASVRIVALLGLGLCLLGALTASVANDFLMLALAYGLLFGLGITCAGPITAQVLVTQVIPPERRGLAFGIVLTGTSLGAVVFAPLAALGVDMIGWRATLAVMVPSAVLAVAPFVWRFLPREHPTLEVRAEDGARVERRGRVAEITSSSVFWGAMMAVVPALFAFTAVQFHLDPFAREEGISSVVASLAMSVMATTMILAKVASGYLTDRHDPRWIGVGALLLFGAGLTLLGTSPSGPQLVTGCLLLGFANGSFLPLMSAWFARAFSPSVFARALGFAMPLLSLGGFGGVAAGWMNGALMGYGRVFVALAAVVATGTLAAAGLQLLTCMGKADLRT